MSAHDVDDFNRDNPLGTKVRFWAGVREGAGRTGYIGHPATILGGHTPVAWIREDGTGENVGAVALTHVEPIEVPA